MVKRALLVIDIQHDFLPGGALAVAHGDEIVDGVVKLLQCSEYHWDAIVFSQDWHPKDHTSFASNHLNTEPFTKIQFTSTKDHKTHSMETVWPDHCVQHTHGANFPEELIDAYKEVPVSKTIVQKGQLQDRDFYSAFNDIWDDETTELAAFLKKNAIDEVFVCGLAYDYCVKFTSASSAKMGFKTFVIKPLCRAIELDKLDETDAYFKSHGVEILESVDGVPK